MLQIYDIGKRTPYMLTKCEEGFVVENSVSLFMVSKIQKVINEDNLYLLLKRISTNLYGQTIYVYTLNFILSWPSYPRWDGSNASVVKLFSYYFSLFALMGVFEKFADWPHRDIVYSR